MDVRSVRWPSDTRSGRGRHCSRGCDVRNILSDHTDRGACASSQRQQKLFPHWLPPSQYPSELPSLSMRANIRMYVSQLSSASAWVATKFAKAEPPPYGRHSLKGTTCQMPSWLDAHCVAICQYATLRWLLESQACNEEAFVTFQTQ